MKRIHVNTTFNNELAEKLEAVATHAIGKLSYSQVLRTAFIYYCENNEDAKKLIKERGTK